MMVRCSHTFGLMVYFWLIKHLVLFLFDRYWRRRLGLQVDYAEHDGYRFCYTHRGKPGSRPSILMLHGFSAHKDMWLGVVKVWASCHPAYIIKLSYINKPVCPLQYCIVRRLWLFSIVKWRNILVDKTHFQIFSSFKPTCIWCVLTCLAMRALHALVKWTTPLKARSKGYIRYCLLSFLNVHALMVSHFGSL